MQADDRGRLGSRSALVAVAAAVLAVVVVLVILMSRGFGQPAGRHPTPTGAASPPASIPATTPPSAAGLTVMSRAVDPTCASNGRRLAVRCPVSATFAGFAPGHRAVFVLPTWKYVMSPNPPYDVTLQRGPDASCSVALPASSPAQPYPVGCTIAAPQGYGFSSSSPRDLGVGITSR